MKFTTLFLIASTALAFFNGDRSDNTGKLAKRDAGPADLFVFPTDDDDDYGNGYDNDQPPLDENPAKNFYDNNGNRCWDMMYDDLDKIPVECMKPIFCNNEYPRNKVTCRKVHVDKDNWTKDDVVNKVRSHDCVREAICKDEDIYNL